MARYFRRKKFCKFTADGVESIDYQPCGIRTIPRIENVKQGMLQSEILAQAFERLN